MPIERKGSAEEIDRLARERDEADRRYNEALTKLDAAIQRPREFPHPPPSYDEFQITPLNERWELLSLKPDAGGGWLKRLRAHPQSARAHIAAVTANIMHQTRLRAKDAGFDSFISKPIRPDKICDQIRSMLNGHAFWW